jgi:hypothetical protein
MPRSEPASPLPPPRHAKRSSAGRACAQEGPHAGRIRARSRSAGAAARRHRGRRGRLRALAGDGERWMWGVCSSGVGRDGSGVIDPERPKTATKFANVQSRLSNTPGILLAPAMRAASSDPSMAAWPTTPSDASRAVTLDPLAALGSSFTDYGYEIPSGLAVRSCS